MIFNLLKLKTVNTPSSKNGVIRCWLLIAFDLTHTKACFYYRFTGINIVGVFRDN